MFYMFVRNVRLSSISSAVLASLMLATTACQLAPTKSTSRETRDGALAELQKLLEITDNTVVLDSREAFDYGLNHITNAIHLPWENLAESAETGEVLRDSRKAAQKIALLGISPNTPVIVTGRGMFGHGEEGRVAWTLKYLGVQDVEVANVDLFRKVWTQKETPAPKNAPEWKPQLKPEMIISRDEFIKVAKDAKGRLAKRIHILDVRSEEEYLQTGAKGAKGQIDLNAINIPWKEFYNSQGRPSTALRKRLESVNVQPDDRVLVVSNHGVRSSSASYALMALGYRRVQNFVGGWRSLNR